MEKSKLNQILDSLGGERRIDFRLERFHNALKSAGNPEKNVQTLIVGGTNGKGSTTLLIAAALRQAGFRTLTYLSPHLQSPTERILHDLIPIEEEELTALAEEFISTARLFNFSYFEYLTFLVFIHAKRRAPDFLVLEVGLGGRLDATNVTNPLASVITNIALDHQNYLGNTLESILEEKMGILRHESLVFTGIDNPSLLQQLEKRCLELDAIPYFSREIRQSCLEVTWQGQKISLNDHPFTLTNPSLGTVENASLAFLLLRILFPRLPLSTLQAGFSSVCFPGRLEVVQTSPRVVLSGDHNPAGILNLKKSLSRLPTSRVKIVCGFSPDKPAASMLESLHEITSEVVLTEIEEFRARRSAGYSNLAPFKSDAKKAIEEAIQSADPSDTILVTGSLYLVGEVRKLWHSRVSFLNSLLGAERPSDGFPGASSGATLRQEASTQTHVR